MSKHAVEITQIYSPAPGWTITVDHIPAIEINHEDRTETVLEMAVSARLYDMVHGAVRAGGAREQHLTFRGTE
ncbi:MAG TPA: hypothetical protein VGX96_18090 [Candidatus Elarobacter sp.]|jgi:hypothetical protein|nr:hypothetical protein [Candidatus Elarobacter sp.]